VSGMVATRDVRVSATRQCARPSPSAVHAVSCDDDVLEAVQTVQAVRDIPSPSTKVRGCTAARVMPVRYVPADVRTLVHVVVVIGVIATGLFVLYCQGVTSLTRCR